MLSGKTQSARREAAILAQMEQLLQSADDKPFFAHVSSLHWLSQIAAFIFVYNWLSITAVIIGCSAWGVFCVMASLFGQALAKSTMRYPSFGPYEGERTGLQYGWLAPTGCGKTSVGLFTCEVAELLFVMNIKYLQDHNIIWKGHQFQSLYILFTCSRIKAALQQIGYKDGMGIFLLNEGS